MSKLNLQKLFPEHDPEWWEGVLLFDDMDAAFIGLATQFTKDPVAVYDRDLCLACLEKQGMSPEAADEWFEVNTVGSWVGDRTPMVIVRAKGR